MRYLCAFLLSLSTLFSSGQTSLYPPHYKFRIYLKDKGSPTHLPDNPEALFSGRAIGKTNGTSLSSPFLAGLIASLWSINPSLHRAELLDIVKRSSDRYVAPDFHRAMREVLAQREVSPVSYSFRLLDESGCLLSAHRFNAENVLFVPLSDMIRKNNRFLYFVTEKPLKRHIYKVKI